MSEPPQVAASPAGPPVSLDDWMGALLDRHSRAFTRPELLKAIRALSVRYVERRAELTRRSPLDSVGKRAAFAVFYAPLHLLTVRCVVRALGLERDPINRLVDLGCGAGASSAGWALALDRAPSISGVDRDQWAAGEASWNWRQLGLSGRSSRGDMLDDLDALTRGSARHERGPGRPDRTTGPGTNLRGTGIIFGWSVNELDASSRARALDALLAAASAGACILIVEPLARASTPWWPQWAERVTTAGGRDDLWKFPPDLPPALADLDEAAGFRREALGARTLCLRASPWHRPQRLEQAISLGPQ
jgi:hypothetical protein